MNCSPCLLLSGYEKSIAHKGALLLLLDVVCLVVWTASEQPGLLKCATGSLVALHTWAPGPKRQLSSKASADNLSFGAEKAACHCILTAFFLTPPRERGLNAISSRKPFQMDAFTYSLNKHICSRPVLGTQRWLHMLPAFLQ